MKQHINFSWSFAHGFDQSYLDAMPKQAISVDVPHKVKMLPYHYFGEQEYRSRYHWLPWCTFVEVDPASRFVDTFGAHEIADIEKLPPEELKRRNRIYDHYAP